MWRKLILNSANIINDNIDETNIKRVKISSEKNRFSPAIFNMVTEAGKFFFSNLHITGLSRKPGLRLLSSIFNYSVIVIEEIVLLVLLSVYFIIGATAVILYIIFYEKIYEKLFNKRRKEKHNSTRDYKLKYQHLKLNCD
jgi:hypothetical protein